MKNAPLLLLFALASSAGSVHAQSRPQRSAPAPSPQALYRQGETEYAEGRYEAAIALWERAYALDPRPALQYNLAQAYGRAAMFPEERRALELFLSRLAEEQPEELNSADATSARARIAAIDER